MAALNRTESDANDLWLSGVFAAADLAPIRDRTGAIARESGFTEAQTYRFVLAVSEAVTNVIQHATGSDGELAIFNDGQALIAEVMDHGPGMGDADTGSANDPGVGSTGGRGLWLMRQYVDEMRVTSLSGGTWVRLALTLPRYSA